VACSSTSVYRVLKKAGLLAGSSPGVHSPNGVTQLRCNSFAAIEVAALPA
jgi:hypothetical protein